MKSNTPNKSKKSPSGLATISSKIMIKDVPSYGNKFFYSLGFLSMISFVMLVLTGIIMTFYGPNWWLTNSAGQYMRSVHLWATQAFVIFILLHLLIVFFTSGFKKPRRLTWVIGVIMLFIVLAETEFGYVLRGDYSSQWRSLQGADFYNGSGLGRILNPLNTGQIYGIHIAVIPIAIISLLLVHYLLVRVLGIAKPYKKDLFVKTVPADHKLLFIRGGVLAILIFALAAVLPSPYIKATTIQSVAQDDPALIGKTLIMELNKSSDTATYMDNIDPYTYDTRSAYIDAPYNQLLATYPTNTNALTTFNNEPQSVQQEQLSQASDFYAQDGVDISKAPKSPVTDVINSLTAMAESGSYESTLNSVKLNNSGSTMYATRFLADTGVLEDSANALNITTDQYGMIREEKGRTPGAWWLVPIGLLNHSVLKNDDNGDRDAAIIFGSLLLTMLAFPFIPYVNQLPDKLKVYKLIWHEKKR